MNSLLIRENEGWESGDIVLVGKRARDVFHSNQFVLGQRVIVAQLGGDKGVAEVCRYGADRIELTLRHTEPSLALRPIDLVVGLARPQTTKKIIQIAVMSGVRSLHLVHTTLGEKSYLDSHILKPEFLQDEVVKALEQIGEGLYPNIYVHRSFRFLPWDQFEPPNPSQAIVKLVAVPGEPLSSPLVEDSCRGLHGLVLAVGPEAGWTDKERSALLERGFTGIGLGPRIVRVELALALLLGQSLLADFVN